MGLFDLLRRAMRFSRHNPWLSAMGTATVAISLTLVAVFGLAASNARNAVADWSRDLQVVIYLDPPPSEALTKQWLTALRSIAEVDEVAYVSSDEALQRFRGRLGNDAMLLDGIAAGVLPASLEISLHPEFRNQRAITSLVARLRQNSDWRDIQYGRDWVERFDAVARLLRMIGTALGVVLIFASCFIISNTIRLMFLSRRDEIEVMRLVGATPLYINLPFLVEGTLQGAIGGVTAVAFGYGLYVAGVQQGLAVLLQAVGVNQVHFLPIGWQAGLVVTGGAIGLFGSLAALRKLSKE